VQPRRSLFLALTVVLIAGCTGPKPTPDVPTSSDTPFAEAYPPRDGSLWPLDLTGPFEALPLEHVTTPSFDGTILDGFLSRPKLPAGVLPPILINSSPYLATSADNEAADDYVAAGFAHASFSVRGTGNSGGCLDFFGEDEQRDQAALIDWAAAQPWGSGRVGMFGGSYPGTTVLQAAVQAPPGLKAAVAVAPVPDLFTMLATPQGALWNEVPTQLGGAFTGIAAAPRIQGDDPQGHLEGVLAKLAGGDVGRLCPDVAEGFGKLSLEPATSMRDSAFWKERDLRMRLADVRAPLMYTDGYYDDEYFEGAHVWDYVTGAPFEYVTGPWPHSTPSVPGDETFTDVMLHWFDFWLKGVGEPPVNLGKAYWQDTLEPGVYPNRGDGEWHQSDAWPPPESLAHRFNLSAQGLSEKAPGVERSYRAVSVVEGTSAPVLGEGGWQWPKNFLCDDAEGAAEPVRLVFPMDAMGDPWLLAGIPTLDLTITSDEPGGIVNAFLILEDAGEEACDETDAEGPALISFGAADLLFVDDIYTEKPFPTGTPRHIQIELTDIAQVVQPGQRLVLVIGAGNAADHQTRYAPVITIHEGTPESPTFLTLPIMEQS
jgi:putative CocE/NonD family hydrolase